MTEQNTQPEWYGQDLQGQILGRNSRYYPSEHVEPVEVLVVLVGGRIGDYAAYVGSGSDEWVKSWGNKLSFEEAKVHFPGLDSARYRGF